MARDGFLPSLVAPIPSRAMWIEESLASLDSSAFIYGYEFAHVLIGSTATIHLSPRDVVSRSTDTNESREIKLR
jgi:hypothetical protein